MPEMLDLNAENLEVAGVKKEEGEKITMRADANYFSEENLKACEERGVDAVIPDSQAKRRLGPEGRTGMMLTISNMMKKKTSMNARRERHLNLKGQRSRRA